MRLKGKKNKDALNKPSKKRKALKIILIIFICLFVLAGAAMFALYYYVNSTDSGPSPAGKHYPGQPIKKSETVYVDNFSSGKPTSVIVDAYVRNNTEQDEIIDKTTLKNIVNINGDEEYRKNDDGTITWPAHGADMYYEGEASSKDIPVTMDVKYYLDGKPIRGEDLEGKSGKLEIHIKYHNKKHVEIKGEDVPVPFLVLSALVVTDNSLKKIKINQGKVLNQSGVKVAMGVSAPGIIDELEESAIGENFKGEIVIKGVAKKFKGNEIISMVSSDMLKFVSKKNLNKLNMDKKITRLDKATKRIKKGTAKLAKGVSLLNKRTPELTKGITQAKDGSEKLADNTHKAMNELNDGSVKLGDLGKAIHDAIVKIDNKMSDSTDPQATGIVTKANNVSTKVNEIYEGMPASNTTEEIDRLKGLVNDSLNMTEEEKSTINNYLEVIKTLESDKTTLSADSASVATGTEEINQLLDGQKEGESVPTDLMDFINDNPDSDQLKREDGTYMGLVDASLFWNDKNDEMSDQIYSLDNDDDSLVAGAKDLAEGMRKIDNGATNLEKGIKKIDKGSTKLSKGMNQYYDKAIKKIVKLYNDQLSGVAKSLIGMKEAGDEYTNFSGITNEMDGSVTFMYFTPIGDW